MTTRKSLPAALALALSGCLLAACGGGSNGIVRTESAGPPLSPPPPPPPPAEACPSPVTSDCVISDMHDPAGNLVGIQTMGGGRTSAYALIARMTTVLELQHGVFRFDGGTRVESGVLVVEDSATLDSDTHVLAGGALLVTGTLQGGLTNDGSVMLTGKVIGNVLNNGDLRPGSNVILTTPGLIDGNLVQSATGTLVAVMGTDGGHLSVTGRADIDGTLELSQATDNGFGAPVAPPATPFSVYVLHADGGVYGQFAQWTSPGLFITGSLRYAGNDVYFDASAISAAQVMAAAHAGDAVTLAAANNFDTALGHAGNVAQRPGSGLTTAQRQFLTSASMIQRIQDYAQAVRAFDSLSAHGYLDAADALLRQAALPTPGLADRLHELHPGSAAGTWATGTALSVAGGAAFSRQSSGIDMWLGDRLLLGGSVGWSDGNLRFDRLGGTARDRSPQWDFYLLRSGPADSYVLGEAGYSHHQLELDRTIDLGLATRTARSRHNLEVRHAWIEAGREFAIPYGRLTPFAAMSYATLRDGAFVEQGDSGFELVAQPSSHQRVNAVAGLRLDRQWRLDDGHWLQLNVSAGYEQRVRARDHSWAAFTGAPDAPFALTGMPGQASGGWLHMNLGSGGESWTWLMSYDRQAGIQALSLGTEFRF